MKRVAPLLLLALLVPAAADAAPAWSVAAAKRALVARPFAAVDSVTHARHSFRVPAGALWRLKRVAPNAFLFDGPVTDLLADQRIRVRFRFERPGAVRAFRGPEYAAREAALPVRGAFYYPWYPRNWNDGTVFTPSRGRYDSDDPRAIRWHVQGMLYGNVDAGIYSWWGRGDRTDEIFLRHLAVARGTGFRWAIYYEPEGYGNPSVERLRSDLAHIYERYARDPGYLRLDGKPVLFVWGDGLDACETPVQWREANGGRFYVVLKVFPHFQNCEVHPEGWHQYEPALPDDAQLPWAYTISPGFHRAGGEPERLARDLARWQASIARMVASGARFQLITSYNEWTEGTSVESAAEWASASGFGAYLDALHAVP